MKKTVLLIIMCFCGLSAALAQNTTHAKTILDKTAKVLGRKGGVCAKFTMSSAKTGKIDGTIAVKGKMFNARTGQAIVWFDGKTQWTYMRNNEEVNVTNPTPAQQQMMNPYAFINIYRTGYNLSTKPKGNNHEIHLVAQNKQKSIQEMYISVNKKTYTPTSIRMKHSQTWYTITISDFQAKDQPNRSFTFNHKDFPNAEIIDLR